MRVSPWLLKTSSGASWCLGLRGACWAGGGRLGGQGVQKPNVSHRFGSIFVPQTRPWRLQDGPQRAQDGPKMAPRGSKMIPNGPKMAPREPKMVRTTPRTPPDQRSDPIFGPLGPPKRPQEAPQFGHVAPPKSDDVIEDPALFAPLKLCQSQGRRWEGSRPEKKAY